MHRGTSVGNPDPILFSAGPTPAPSGRYVRVAVERGLDDPSADGLTYAAPDDSIQVGERVVVPLGKGDKPAGGVVIAAGGPELLAGLAASRIKPILRATGIRLPPRLAELAHWLSAYYICPLGMVMSTMLPAAVKHQTGRRSTLFISPGPLAAYPPLPASPVPPTSPSLRGEVGALPAVPVTDESSSQSRSSPVPPTSPSPRGEVGALPPVPPPPLSRKARDLLARITALPPQTFPIAIDALAGLLALSTRQPLLRLIRSGQLIAEARESISARTLHEPRLARATSGLTLTTDQSRIIDAISPTLDRFGVHLIRGVTGSGKTEVYIRLIEIVLATGRTALILVPEIALTPQTSERFRDRFPAVAVLHSGLTAAQRHREWARASTGQARVVVGARSAVFAPLPDLGLIVVDEEHDNSYKQDQLPRYHARDVAIKRAQLEACPVILGSATPSLESWANAAGPGARFRLHELPHRAGPGRLPKVEIIDLMAERKLMRTSPVPPTSPSPRGEVGALTSHPRHCRPGLIGPTLMSALARTLDAGGQAILLLNRRGYSSYLCCSDQNCGWVLACDNCDAAMVLHMDRAIPTGRLVKCHHCLAEQLIPKSCALCAKPIIWLGGGTQRIEEELIDTLGPSHGLAEDDTLKRLDSDSMRTARDYFDALARFGEGRIKVLVGTQMIAKGLDYPNVRLVGIINADTALALPDFRAAERTFQLISQVAGRAGRGEHPGRVILQTVQPHHPVITLAAAHDYTTFAEHELALRRAARLPPATRMARIVTRDKKEEKARDRAAQLADFFRRHRAADSQRDLLIRGPMPCPISRIAGYFRYALELTAPTPGLLQSLLTAARNASLLKSDHTTAVDVDPVAMM
ncbi:MAG: primosomal protein N' [Phycisphaerales bacterium]|nr:primosomal protein N' [Phycisphaerales bacterium]